MTQHDAIELLRQKVADFGKGGKSRAARELGYSPTVITQILNVPIDYPGSIDNVCAKIIDVYGQIDCPFYGIKIPGPHCFEERKKTFKQTGNVDLFRACRACERGKR